jgi:UDP-N-acetylmuramyl pentapeptide phosphotransferase/UDP-N-acetylglucosamine-1-phosphate transferase
MVGTAVLLVIIVTVISYVGVAYLIRQSRARNWVDVPNERSSHERPTPRGGGLVIALICLTAYVVIALIVRTPFCWGYFVAATLIGVVSWFDDLYSLPIGWRLLVHLVAAVVVVFSCGYFQSVELSGAISLNLGIVGIAVTVFWIVWMTNAYNFMDGIDGLAGIQALAAAAGWTAVAFATGVSGIFYFSLILFAACSGFLIHNWNPARIFMGDVGSSFLGFTFATLPFLFSAEIARPTPWLMLAAVLMVWPFLFDSIVSRFRRFGSGKFVWSPHKEHLYQRLVGAGNSHATVSLIYGVFAAGSAALAVFAVFRPGLLSLSLLLAILLVTAVFIAAVLWRTRAPVTAEGTENARA